MAENKNTFQTTVESLMKGMDGFVSSKTVVGEPIQVGETIILPLVDVSFGMGAGAFCGEPTGISTRTIPERPRLSNWLCSRNGTADRSNGIRPPMVQDMTTWRTPSTATRA